MGAALTYLIPVQELSPGSVSAIRNEVIKSLVQQVSKELNLPQEKLVVRDLRPVEDLVLYSTGTTPATINDWVFTTAGSTATGYVSLTGDASMADQRYVALYGVKDLRDVYDVKIAAATYRAVLSQVVSLLKISVGGGERVVWDLTRIQAFPEIKAGISPTAIIIPQNTLYNISIYKMEDTASVVANILLDGIVVEPRGKVVSP